MRAVALLTMATFTTSSALKPPFRILVTGGNSGIGRALSRQLAVEEGCEVLLGARDSSRGEEAVASIRAELSGGAVGSVSLVVVDVAEDGEVNLTVRPARPHCPCCLLDLDALRKRLTEIKGVTFVQLEVVDIPAAPRWTRAINR